MTTPARSRSAASAVLHFVKWALPLPVLYAVGGVVAGALAFAALERASIAFPDPTYGIGEGYTVGDGAIYGLLFGLASALPVTLGLWVINSFIAGLFRRSTGAGWLPWVFWGFGLAAGLMPVFAFLTSGLSFNSSSLNQDLVELSAERQARATALGDAAQNATVILTLIFFIMALLVSWWNWRAGRAWSGKASSESVF